MYDPRMQQLTEKEGLRGLGAYWVIIEKLGMLPEPRARQEYLRPHCDGKKITLAYLLKIIREYGLFELEEDGYFTPKELNPPRKNDEKTAKKGEAEPYSKAKNDEKRQKTPRENSEKQLPKTSNTLENSKLPKTAEKNNKENINNYIKQQQHQQQKKKLPLLPIGLFDRRMPEECHRQRPEERRPPATATETTMATAATMATSHKARDTPCGRGAKWRTTLSAKAPGWTSPA